MSIPSWRLIIILEIPAWRYSHVCPISSRFGVGGIGRAVAAKDMAAENRKGFPPRRLSSKSDGQVEVDVGGVGGVGLMEKNKFSR